MAYSSKAHLLGPEAAGKSTVRNQFLLLGGCSFSEYERIHWREIIRSSVFDAFRTLAWHMRDEMYSHGAQAEQVLQAGYIFNSGQ